MAEENLQQPLFTIRQKISFAHYLEFNHLMVEDMAMVKRKRTTILGLIEVIVGILFLIVSLLSGQVTNWLYPVLAVILVVMGAYGLLFYRFIFPAQLKKAARKQYDQNEYLQNEVEIQFFEDTFREIAASTDNTVDWNEVERIKYTDQIIALILKNQRCVILQRENLKDFSHDFLDYLKKQSERFSVDSVHQEKQSA